MRSTLEYSIDDSDYFDINSSSGIISLTSTINFEEDIPTINLNVYATGIINDELIGVYASLNVKIIQHYDLTDDNDTNDIPDEFEQNESGNFMLKDNMIIDSSYEDLNLSELNINIDDGKLLTIENGNIKMNNMTIGSEDNSTVIINENGTLELGSLILSETKGDSSELIINEVSSQLIVNEESSIGSEGNGTLSVESGHCYI